MNEVCINKLYSISRAISIFHLVFLGGLHLDGVMNILFQHVLKCKL